jgi:hypothetical protein
MYKYYTKKGLLRMILIYAAERVADIIGVTRVNLSHTAIGSILTKD